MKQYTRIDKEIALTKHHGIFRKQITLWQAVALIVSSTVGAGVLGIPYAVAKVGIGLGLVCLVGLGALLTGLNLLLGKVVVSTKEPLQLSGLARKYLGRFGGWLMTSMIYSAVFGILVIYIIGTGDTLKELLGGNSFFWSVLFFLVASSLIFFGMRTMKKVEFFLTVAIVFVVVLIAAWSAPHISWPAVEYTNLAHLLFPYGVILFAYSGTVAVPEAHSILKNKDTMFKKAIIISGIINMCIYALFAIATVGVTGSATTEIATIGLGQALGPSMFVLANVFALLAMGTSFLIIGLALRDSFVWDYRVPKVSASLIVVGVPFGIFLLGLRHFIAVMDFIGGVLISLHMLLVLFIYWRAKQKGHLPKGKFQLHHSVFLIVALFLALALGTVYSILKLF